MKKFIITYIKVLIFILFLTMSLIFWMKAMPEKSFNQINISLNENQIIIKNKYLEQLNIFAKAPRNFYHLENLRKTEIFLINELISYGYKVNIQEYGINKYKNIEIILPAKNLNKNNIKTIIIGAHYDSGDNTPGADDNASSVVILLDLAKRLQTNFESNYDLRIVFFTNEEPPFYATNDMGSFKYASLLKTNGVNVKGMYALDALGYFTDEPNSQKYPFPLGYFFPDKGNFVAFIGNIESRSLIKKSIGEFRKTAKIPSEGISTLNFVNGVDFSDHRSFYKYGWPALMITDTAFNRNKNYHTIHDTIETLNLDKMVLITDGLEYMLRKLYENKKAP